MNHDFPFPIGTVHIIGIGGIGMSGYAEVLHHLGYKVQGSDQAENANVVRLRSLGIQVAIGHAAGNVMNCDGAACGVVVKSTAVKDSNPEIIAAKEHNIPVIPRVALLSELMKAKWCVNVSGTHGKTTTTSMIGHVLVKSGIDPTVINGGIINAYGSNTRMGKSNWMVVESDESDGTFAKLPSVASIITNIDPEHMDYYGDFDAVKDAYVSYAHNLPFYGIVVACIDHPVVAELIPQFQRRVISYGFSDKADLQAVNVQTSPEGLSYDIRVNCDLLKNFPREIKGVRLPMFGPHNVLNSLTTFAIGHHIGLEVPSIVAALAKFSGVKRRFTTTGIVNGITVIDDYGHHPVEINAVLKAGRDAVAGHGGGRIIAVMQPHRYTRLSSLFDEFCGCFTLADEVIISDVYSAGEEPIAGVNKDALVSCIRKAGKDKVHALENPQALAPLIASIAKPGDFVICLGAGTITNWAYALPKELEAIWGLNEKKANGTK
ncbi:MAG TPA: UDP-N-acetylmuramate--L-alanine ligase [Patescibacteria group bacterium]|nr:UDP-N-acetylmuramate--L-alanine ligase [Patescibacteria group bacterium]